jgi:predicted acylesterase/phospholipase RssA
MGKRSIERVLVLSGGGARGAYQVGVCQYLEEIGWKPDMVLCNSIGSTNGAVLLAPNYDAVKDRDERAKLKTPADLLEYMWLKEMVNRKLRKQRSSSSLPPRPLLLELVDLLEDSRDDSRAFDKVVKKAQAELAPEIGDFKDWVASVTESRLSEEEVAEELIKFFVKVLRRTRGRYSLIPRPGWRRVLEKYVDLDKLNSQDVPYFGMMTTDVLSGVPQMFWNRVPPHIKGTKKTTMDVRHILASSSIPAIYKATRAEADDGEARYRWDGVLVANSPVAPAVDLIESVKCIIVVLTSLWCETPECPPPEEEAIALDHAVDQYAPTVGDALKRHVVWWMLAPLRSELRKLTREQLETKVKIVWPHDLAKPSSSIKYLANPVSIIDYRRKRNRQLFKIGRKDAKKQLGKI